MTISPFHSAFAGLILMGLSAGIGGAIIADRVSEQDWSGAFLAFMATSGAFNGTAYAIITTLLKADPASH